MPNQIIKDVLLSLGKINKDYYEIPNVKYSKGGLLVDNDDKRAYERRFILAFTCEYAKIIDKKRSLIYQGTQKDFEVPKQYMYGDFDDLKVRETFEKLHKDDANLMSDYFTTYPDFLIHKSRNSDKKKENQKLIIEAKTSPKTTETEIFKDMFHINIYADKYNYQNNVLLLVHFPKDKWIKCLKKYLHCDYFLCKDSSRKNVYIIFKTSYSSKPEVFKLNQLITQISN